MHVLKRILLAVAATAGAAAAVAQDGGYDGAQFVKAIQDGKSDDAVKLFKDKPSLVNARDFEGMTALIAAIDKRDREWAGYLLQQGADPNLPARTGETPLMAASRVGMSGRRGIPSMVKKLPSMLSNNCTPRPSRRKTPTQ